MNDRANVDDCINYDQTIPIDACWRPNMNGIATLRDVERRDDEALRVELPPSTYELIRRGVGIDPNAPALSFFLEADAHRKPETWT